MKKWLVVVLSTGLMVAQCGGGGGGGGQDCNSLCQKTQAAGCDPNFNMQECLDGCNWAKTNMQSAFFNEAANCLDKPCDQQEQCTQNAMSACSMPSNKDTVIDAYCNKGVQCGDFPDVATCKSAIGTQMDSALKCFTETGITNIANCIQKSTCDSNVDSCFVT